MKPLISLTKSQTLQALRTFLLGIVPDGVEVVQAQDNRVPAPTADDYITMNVMLHTPLGTTRTTFHDGAFDDTPTPGVRMDLAPAEVKVQLDIHGPQSFDVKTVIASLFRSSYATQAFKAMPFDVAPLYFTDPHQVPYGNDQQQIETTWVMDVHLQCNPVVTTGQDFAASFGIGLTNVDTKYPA